MTRKIIGKTTILCAVIVITIALVITAWAVTSRFSRKTVEQTSIVEETSLTESVEDIPKQAESDLKTDTAETDSTDIEVRMEPVEGRKQQFKQIERDFVAGSSNVRQLDDTLTTQGEPRQEALNAGPDQAPTVTQTRESAIEQVRLEAGKIVDRSGLFSSDQSTEDELLISASERDHGVSTAKVHSDEEIPKDMDARRTVVSERKAYQEAKNKVDTMLKSLGYVD